MDGKKDEKEALNFFERQFSCNIKYCGIFVSKSVVYLCASLDDIMDNNVICEVKCPYTAGSQHITEQTIRK